MDPHLVLFTVSIFPNKPVLFVNREVVRIIKESLVRKKEMFKGGA